jgi:signal peptide peptidase SppA
MQRQLILSQLASQPWAMEPTHLANMASVLHRWASGEPASTEAMEVVRAGQAARQARKASAPTSGGTVAVLPLYGVVTQRSSAIDDVCGGVVSTEKFAQSFRDAMADDSVLGILIDLDSPGGSVFGTEDLANEIYKARGKKPIVGFVNSLCASAAYWIGSQCDELYSAAGGMTGSIGVYTQHIDVSGAMEKSGIKQEFIAAGKYKIEGNSYGPLSDEARAFTQSQIDAYYSAFTKAVARGRGVNVSAVRGGMGQGRCLLPADALAAGMINGISTMSDVVARIVQLSRSAGSQARTNARSISTAQSGAMSHKSEQEEIELQRALRERQIQLAKAGAPLGKTERERAAIEAANRRRQIELAKIS